MRVLGDCFQREPIKALQAARSCGWLLASELLAVGVDFSFAPVLDLDTGNSSVIGDRAFDGDPGVVSILASCLIDGMHEAGMSVVGKHFPGHGSVTADSHLELPVDTRGLEVMMEQDMIPFGRLAAKLDAVMPAHVLYSAVDSVPAGISSVWLQEILRAKLGFEGLIISDDLSMEGIAGSGDYYTRGQKSLEAGCDILLACNNRAGVRELLKLPVNNQAAIQSQLHRMLGKQVFEFNTLKNTERWNIALKTIKALED
jgi:beta-N-acetylhexosaminidase